MKKCIVTCSALLILSLGGAAALAQQSGQSPIVVSQGEPALELSSLTGTGHWELRIYTINRGRMDDFVNAWLDGVYHVRVAHGFKIPAAWIVREKNQFVWILGHEGPEDWETAQRNYYGSAARTGLDVDPLQFIASGDTLRIAPVTSSR